jgi:hypothetical protein
MREGMARQAIAEVHRPRQRGNAAVGAVGEAGEEAADATDGGAEGKGVNEEVAGGAAQAQEVFDELHPGPAAEQAADDGFAAEEDARVVAQRPVERGALGPGEELGAEPGAEDTAEQKPERGLQRQGVGGDGGLAAEVKIQARADEVGEALDHRVRVEAQAKRLEVNRGNHGVDAMVLGPWVVSKSRSWRVQFTIRSLTPVAGRRE